MARSETISASPHFRAGHAPGRLRALMAATTGMAAAYGGLSTIGVLIEPFQAEFGWLRADISSGYVLMALGSAAGGLVAGRMADRYSTGPIAAFGTAILGIGLLLLSAQSSFSAMLAICLMMGLLGFSCLYAPLLACTAQWFPDRAGMAFGIVTAGGALGQAFIPPVLQFWTLDLGWRDACASMGVVYIAVLGPLMLFATKPDDGRREAGQSSAADRAASFPVPPLVSIALLCLAALFCCNLMGVPTVHLIAFAQQQGLEPTTAAGVLTTTMLAAMVGRVATGFIIDRFGSLRTYLVVSLVQTVGVASFVVAVEPASLHLVGILYGFGFGGVMTALVCSVRDAVAPRHVGFAMAFVGLLAWVGMASGGYQGGICFDLTGSYVLPFGLAALAGIANIVCILALLLLARRGAARAHLKQEWGHSCA